MRSAIEVVDLTFVMRLKTRHLFLRALLPCNLSNAVASMTACIPIFVLHEITTTDLPSHIVGFIIGITMFSVLLAPLASPSRRPHFWSARTYIEADTVYATEIYLCHSHVPDPTNDSILYLYLRIARRILWLVSKAVLMFLLPP